MTYRLEERRLLGPRAYRTVWTTSYHSRAAALADLAAVAANMEQVCRPLRDDDGTELVPASGRSPYAHDGTHRLVLVEIISAARTADPDAADDTRPEPPRIAGRVSRPSAVGPPPPRREAPPAPWFAGGARDTETPIRVGACALSGARARVSVTGLPPECAAGANAGKSDPSAEEEPRPGSGAPGGASTDRPHVEVVGGASDALRAPHPMAAAASTRTAAADGASSSPFADAPAPPAGTSPPAGGVTRPCTAVAESCYCRLAMGHDGPHECEPEGCGGQWYGTPGHADFLPVRYPGTRWTQEFVERHVDEVLAAGRIIAEAVAADGFVVDPLDALGPRLVEPAPRHDPALDIPELAWISVRRTGIDRHRPAPGVKWTAGPADAVYLECVDTACTDRRAASRHAHLARTLCGRVIRTGELLAADDPWVVEHTTPCPRCWPGGAA